MTRPRVGVFLSGGGRTLVNLCDAIDAGTLECEIPIVVASRGCAGVERARDRGLVTLRKADWTPDELDAFVEEHRLDWLVLAGYLRLLPITERVRGRVVNIHPALLPDFGGPGMHGMKVHNAVIESGRSESGCTVHLCDERYDTGPILEQSRCPVLPDDTHETLAARVFELECTLYPRTLQRLFTGGYLVEGAHAKRVGA